MINIELGDRIFSDIEKLPDANLGALELKAERHIRESEHALKMIREVQMERAGQIAFDMVEPCQE